MSRLALSVSDGKKAQDVINFSILQFFFRHILGFKPALSPYMHSPLHFAFIPILPSCFTLLSCVWKPYLSIAGSYSPFIKRWVLALASSRIWRFFVISSYTVQCCELWNLKRGPKRVPELGFEPQNALLQAGSNGLDFDGFSQFSAFGPKLGRNPILAMACFLDKKTSET